MGLDLNLIKLEIQRLLQNTERKILGVCGLGGAGKSTLCREVHSTSAQLTCIFEIDWYLIHSSSERKQLVLKSLENPLSKEYDFWQDPTNWYDWEILLSDLSLLKKTGKLFREGLWHQETGDKILTKNIEIDTPSVILCDGIYLLHSPIRELLDRVVLVEALAECALDRSAKRDAHRNPEPYKRFKANVSETFDLPYFRKNSFRADLIVSVS